MFTCPALLSTCNEVLDSGELAIYLLDLPSVIGQSLDPMRNKTLDELIKEGWDQRNKIEPLKWGAGQSKEQVAYLCPTSGHRDYRYIK